MIGGPWTWSMKGVLGPVPLRGSMDQGSMFCTFPVFTPLLSMMVSMSHNYYCARSKKNFVGCVALVTTINKSDEGNKSAKILTNVQTFRDCALHQWWRAQSRNVWLLLSNYYLLLTNSLFILILSEFHRGCLIWVKFVEILK